MTPFWRIYSLEQPYYGAHPVKERLTGAMNDSELFWFGTVKVDEDLVVSICHTSDSTLMTGRDMKPDARIDPSKDKYVLKTPDQCTLSGGSPDTVIHRLDDSGRIRSVDQAVAYANGDFIDLHETGKLPRKFYDVEIAEGIDAALIALVVTIKDWDVGRLE